MKAASNFLAQANLDLPAVDSQLWRFQNEILVLLAKPETPERDRTLAQYFRMMAHTLFGKSEAVLESTGLLQIATPEQPAEYSFSSKVQGKDLQSLSLTCSAASRTDGSKKTSVFLKMQQGADIVSLRQHFPDALFLLESKGATIISVVDETSAPTVIFSNQNPASSKYLPKRLPPEKLSELFLLCERVLRQELFDIAQRKELAQRRVTSGTQASTLLSVLSLLRGRGRTGGGTRV